MIFFSIHLWCVAAARVVGENTAQRHTKIFSYEENKQGLKK
jgi:hypothetical protein